MFKRLDLWIKTVRMLALSLFIVGKSFQSIAATNSPTTYQGSSTIYPVDVVRYEWRDAKRKRMVPVKIYFPQTNNGSFPVIVFSHGLGGTRENYEYLGRYWAAHGFVSVHLQHLGSDAAVWQDSPLTNVMTNLRRSAANMDNAENRPLDVSFVIDQLEKLNRETPPLKGHLDLTRIGVAGHSFGAFTTLAVAGQVFVVPGGREISYADKRVKAAIAMSSPVPARKETFDRAFGKISIPIFHMTGTDDFSPIGNTHPEERRIPFDHIRGVEEFLLTFNGGDHSVFAGVYSKQSPQKEERFKELICESSTAFWDAYLKAEARAKMWLTNDFKSALVADGKFEIKMAPSLPH